MFDWLESNVDVLAWKLAYFVNVNIDRLLGDNGAGVGSLSLSVFHGWMYILVWIGVIYILLRIGALVLNIFIGTQEEEDVKQIKKVQLQEETNTSNTTVSAKNKRRRRKK